MTNWTRRDLLKTAAAAGVTATGRAFGAAGRVEPVPRGKADACIKPVALRSSVGAKRPDR